MFDTGGVALVESVPDDEIEAEFAASLPPDELAAYLERVQRQAHEQRRADRQTAVAAALVRHRPGDPRSLAEAAERVRPVSLARDQLLPVIPALLGLLPDPGLARGSMVSVGATNGGGSTALALALAAASSAAGSWVASVGLANVGLAAAAELGVALERFAVITPPPDDTWATVVAALVGAFDIVLMGPPPVARLAEARRLATRSRERGSVLIQIDPMGTSRLEVDLRLTVRRAEWVGLGQGHGHVRGRRLEVEATGRRRASRPRRVDLWLLDPSGRLLVGEADDAAAYAGSDVDQLVAARRDRIRRVARQPLPAPPPVAPAAVWSDAG